MLPLIGTISTYALVRTAYVFVAFVLVTRLNARQGIAPVVTWTAFAFGVPAGILGAHLLDLVEYTGHYRQLADLVGRDGSSIYGAFIAVFPAVWLYTHFQGIPTLRFLDGGAPAMALGEAMTRVGCFLNGCCYGMPWSGPLAVTFPPESFAYHDQVSRGLLRVGASGSLAVHPVQLYSMAIMLVVFGVLLRMLRRPHRDGAVFYTFLLAYGALRLGMAPLRQEALVSMVVFSAGFVLVGDYRPIAGR